MGELLEGLHRLQVVELKLAVIRRNRETKLRQIELFQKKVKQVEDKLIQHQRTSREQQMRLDSLSLDAAAREESINKHRQALAKAKTNREYAAILTAMNTEKADNAKVEGDALQRMEELQSLKNVQTALEAEHAKASADVKRAEQALAEFDAAGGKELAQIQAQRNEIALRIEPTALAAFTRLALKHEGEAMAPVEKVHPKRDDYVCGGCNINLRLEIINALATREDVQLCHACGRILYLPAQAATTAKR